MALGSANKNRPLIAHGYSLDKQSELSAVETGDLTTGDLAYVSVPVSVFGESGLVDYHYWALSREATGIPVHNRSIFSRDANSSSSNPGRWILTDIHFV